MSATPTDSDPPSTSLHAAKKSSRAAKARPSRIVVLQLPAALLEDFPFERPSGKSSATKSPITVTGPQDDAKLSDSPPQDKDKRDDDAKATDAVSTSNLSEANGDTSLAPPAVNGLKRKGGPGSKSEPGQKLSAGTDTDAANPKPRGKPGPKKRKGLDGEGGTKGMWTAPAPLNHKLGPKANQGDINARLRALDRSGAPCRKWQRKGLQLSSFNGVKWDLAGWKTPKVSEDSGFEGDVKSESGSSEVKQDPASSNVASEKSQTRADSNAPPASTTDLASSPAPLPAIPAVTATS